MVINPPPPDIQPIIDKMADYVARNGPEFEIVVRRRNDARFTFIEPNHQHHAYYSYKKNLFIAVSSAFSFFMFHCYFHNMKLKSIRSYEMFALDCIKIIIYNIG